MKPHVLAATLLVACTALASPANAVNVRDCDETASIRTLAEPWEKNTRTFYNGDVRVALLDTGGEPVCCSVHLLILVPDKTSEMGDRTCHIVSDHESMGFAGIDFARLTSKYDPGKGLLITFPYTLYVDGVSDRPGTARVRINLKTGTVTKE
ncbi:MAG: hypothetical protein GC190_03420 [Alphaproteobacteria bacterium]|nr:hypothetical protein [Alphaproteobacteria bacterium]